MEGVGVDGRDTSEHDWLAIGKFRDQGQFAALASMERRSVEMCMSVRFSISEICFCATPSLFARRTCVMARARRSSCNVISSAISVAARFSILRRRLAGKLDNVADVQGHDLFPFLLNTLKMGVKSLVGFRISSR